MKNRKLRRILMKIGISANLQGNEYILQAVEIIKRQKIHTNMITIYEKLSNKNNKTSFQIERAIRYAITKAYKEHIGLKEIYDQIPNNSVFIYDLVFNLDVFEEIL